MYAKGFNNKTGGNNSCKNMKKGQKLQKQQKKKIQNKARIQKRCYKMKKKMPKCIKSKPILKLQKMKKLKEQEIQPSRMYQHFVFVSIMRARVAGLDRAIIQLPKGKYFLLEEFISCYNKLFFAT